MATISEIEDKFIDGTITLEDITSCCNGFSNVTQQTLIAAYFNHKYGGGGNGGTGGGLTQQDVLNLIAANADPTPDNDEDFIDAFGTVIAADI